MILHTIHFICPVTANSVSQLQNHCIGAMSQGATEINIHISSGGGEISYGFAAYAFLKSLPIKVRTHNIGNVDSIANIIFLAGSERIANPESRFLIHPLTWVLNSRLDRSQLDEIRRVLDDDIERFVSIFSTEVSKDVDWLSVVNRASILTSEDALNIGIVNSKKSAILQPDSTNWYVSC